ncbi:alpha/beta hydrolase [Nitrospira sp. KM1]|uniref:alpha/beta fold hydrolase n=1 Tax=Nitrospira sp. KM1 TaxID=1936990 RepID=UPI0013A7AAE9|nr:alpha/beta hydrolase [Nitrospira sp. KM1]BCA56885.1 alpha/beta hydrolase [Nitrospira sp. KM1]
MTIVISLLLALIFNTMACAPRASDRMDAVGAATDGTHTPLRRSAVVNGVQLSYLDTGTGQPVIFVHGVVTTSNIFPAYLNAYSPKFRGIAVDLRGYGDSDKPPTGFTIKNFSEDLIALADHLNIGRPVWVGVSMGGMILQQLALDHPDRVRALVLVSTTDGAMILDKDLPSIGRSRDYHEVSKQIIVESFPPHTAPSLYQPLLDRIPTWNGTVLREALTSMAQANVHGKLSAIQVPTLVVVGAKDDVATPEIARGIQSQIAGARLVQFDTGHFMMAEDPERFRSVLGEFLEQPLR